MTETSQIHPTDTSSTEERLRLFNLARRWEELLLLNPMLAPSRLINRLHAQGVPCDSFSIEAAKALVAATPAAAQGLSAGTAADFLGVKRSQFTHWLQGGFPDAAPQLHGILAEKPTRYYYDTLDLRDLKKFLDTHPEAMNFDPTSAALPEADDEKETL